jgi:hypothetical protein
MEGKGLFKNEKNLQLSFLVHDDSTYNVRWNSVWKAFSR